MEDIHAPALFTPREGSAIPHWIKGGMCRIAFLVTVLKKKIITLLPGKESYSSTKAIGKECTLNTFCVL
jgi:hypothetical protein